MFVLSLTLWGCEAGSPDAAAPPLALVQDPFLALQCPSGATAWGGEPPTAYMFECRSDDGVRHGAYRAWYPDGTRREIGEYSAGKRSGLWSFFHRKGAKISEGRYLGGERDGAWVFWHKSGRLRERVSFRAGEIDRWEPAGHGL